MGRTSDDEDIAIERGELVDDGGGGVAGDEAGIGHHAGFFEQGGHLVLEGVVDVRAPFVVMDDADDGHELGAGMDDGETGVEGGGEAGGPAEGVLTGRAEVHRADDVLDAVEGCGGAFGLAVDAGPDGEFGVVENFCGDGAEQEAAQYSIAVGGHQDQVGLIVGGVVQDAGGGIAAEFDGADGGVAEDALEGRETGFRRGLLGVARGFVDVEQDDLAAAVLGEVAGVFSGLERAGGEVNGEEEFGEHGDGLLCCFYGIRVWGGRREDPKLDYTQRRGFMRLSWNEIRARAARFAEEWHGARYERGETQTFYNEFFDIFGIPRKRVATYEEPVKRLGERRGFIDLFWKGVLLVEQKSAGRNLDDARQQALEYFPGLKDYELPRFVLLSDFQTFELLDLEERVESRFSLIDLPGNVESFAFMLGLQRRKFKDQDPVNIQASELMGRLHDALFASGYTGHDLERFLVRLLFCLFADDTGIFDTRDQFSDLIQQRTNPSGSDVGQWLSTLFEVLNTPLSRRQQALDEDLQRFPYVNGDLFKDRLAIPAFNASMRSLLIDACEFNWDAISPAIFGSLFQSVMDRGQRRAAGAHYTTETNILKVIEPLFLDSLRSELRSLLARRDNGRGRALEAFHARLGQLRLFDPACGCGNFLIIAYRELRLIELEVLKAIYPDRQLNLDIESILKINVDQFYGIEIHEFPARIAEVAMWMMDHIMNNRVTAEFGNYYARIPLVRSPHILNADALEMPWDELLPAEECSYVFGNPPFVGAKYQTPAQRAQVRRIAQLGGSGGTLDYVTAWFIKAGEFVKRSPAGIGFVATNSITQGEQVAQLWPILFDRCELEISFAHRTFAWGSDARGVAHVHVVVIGLSPRGQEPASKRLFSYDDLNGDPAESTHAALAPYLFDAAVVSNRHLVVKECSRPIIDVPRLLTGCQPIDDGKYVFTSEERRQFLVAEPRAEPLFRPFVGSDEFINGLERWVLLAGGAAPSLLRNLPAVRERISAVRRFRLKSPRLSTLRLAETPTRFQVTVIPERPFLVIPEVSSERRQYVPIGWLEPPVVPSNLVRVMLDADLWHFGILTSAMHMAWLRQIGGRLKSDYRYSIGIVYNTFPWPDANERQKTRIRGLAGAILAARSQYAQQTLADLYDPDVMPVALRRAHRALDVAVDKIYRATPFLGDRDRVEHLFGEYERLVAPLTAKSTGRGRGRRT